LPVLSQRDDRGVDLPLDFLHARDVFREDESQMVAAHPAVSLSDDSHYANGTNSGPNAVRHPARSPTLHITLAMKAAFGCGRVSTVNKRPAGTRTCFTTSSRFPRWVGDGLYRSAVPRGSHDFAVGRHLQTSLAELAPDPR